MKIVILVYEKRINLSGKIDFKPANNTFFSLGGTLYNRVSRDFSQSRSLMSSADNRESSQETYRVYGKLTQKFGSEESNFMSFVTLCRPYIYAHVIRMAC